jgi:DsbC/DsbD-like thiol-disulfide interchange protein
MKQIATILLILSSFFSIAQSKDPVVWSAVATKKDAKTYQITITATLPKPWHIYSQNSGEAGPIPTKITFTKNPLLTLVGKITEEGKLEKTFDKLFNTNVLSYGNKVVFVQKVILKSPVKTSITATVNYMVCNNEMCLPPTKKELVINF